MTEKKITLASAAGYFDRLREEGRKEEEANRGYVWTITIDDTATLSALGVAKVESRLRLNCSHVGETPYGVYRGEMSLDFNADISGARFLLGVIGLSADEDSSGWFKNDRFVMKIKPYSDEDEKEFIDSFNADTGKDEKEKAAMDIFNSVLDKLAGNEESEERKATGLWYDWDHHMTEGDMGVYLKMTGGLIYWFADTSAIVDKEGRSVDVDSIVGGFLIPSFKERYTDPIDSPFPYTLKIFEDDTVLFTLYNAKGGPLTLKWKGRIDRIPVEKTEKI